MWDVWIKTVHASHDTIQGKQHDEGQDNVKWWGTEKETLTISWKRWIMADSRHILGCQWDSSRLFYKYCASSEKTEQQLVQTTRHTFPFVVFKINDIIIYVLFVKQPWVLRETYKELVSRRRWCCSCDICPAQPSWLDSAFICSEKVQSKSKKV